MPLIGIEIKLDVTKIDKSRIYEGAKGKYLKLTAFIDTTEPDQYGNHGSVSQASTKEEREEGLKLPILGNSKVFFERARTADTADTHGQAPPTQAPAQKQPAPQQAPTQQAANTDPINDIPFAPCL